MKPDLKKLSCCLLILLILLTLCFIFGHSMKGPEESKEQSDTVGNALRPVIDPNETMSDSEYSFFIRKSGHFTEYALLGFECALLAFLICGRMTLSGASCAAGGCLFAADIDEFIQSFTERGSKVADVLLDFSGAIVGLAIGFSLAYAVRYIYRRKKATCPKKQ